ncbi:hypothetical protein [Haloplanus halobius]|uniref:hypothetical protein n=1 Tax=Haloplanus halobius TaxID=2934938 RepID=UPI00200FAC01|nr:hypothetical protein [Haloplanus sp. XH21]
MTDELTLTVTETEAAQLRTVLDVCLEEGFDIDDIDRAALERVRDALSEGGKA